MMNISLDVFNDHPQLQQELSSDEHVFYTTYLKFVEDKLAHLRIDIEKEEAEQDDRFIIIHILEENNGPMSFYNYSKDLKRKMIASFTQDDFAQLRSDLDNSQQDFHN